MVNIPIGNGSKGVTVMAVYAYTGSGKEANAQNEHIFDTVVCLAAGLGDTPLTICGDLQHEPRKQSRHLEFALSQGRLADLGHALSLLEQHNPCIPMSKEIQKRAWTLHSSTKPSALQW